MLEIVPKKPSDPFIEKFLSIAIKKIEKKDNHANYLIRLNKTLESGFKSCRSDILYCANVLEAASRDYIRKEKHKYTIPFLTRALKILHEFK